MEKIILHKDGTTMTAKMWALVKDKAERGLTMKQVDIPEVGDNDVKIKIKKI